jgi:hypothetical protein
MYKSSDKTYSGKVDFLCLGVYFVYQLDVVKCMILQRPRVENVRLTLSI